MPALPPSPQLVSTGSRRPWSRFSKDDRGFVAALVAIAIFLLVASASHHPAVVDASLRLSSSLMRASGGSGGGGGGDPPVWASTQHGLVQKFFDEPFADHRATFVHAVIRSENETYRTEGAEWDRYVAVPVHIESASALTRSIESDAR